MVHSNTRHDRVVFAGIVGAALAVLGSVGSAEARSAYYPDGTPVYTHARPAYGHPLTVGRRYGAVPIAPVYDPYAGPQAIVTAPLAAASTLVALPFRVVNGVFPAYGDPAVNPLVLVGAPVHAAGQVAQVPFRVLQAPFGGYDSVPY